MHPLQSCGVLEPAPRLAVAVSGGSDSMALCLLAQQWAEQRGGKIIALTVDHGLRAESVEEAEQVHQWLRTKNIEHHILRWEGEKPQTAIQQKARDARYALLAEWCRENNVWHLLLAHTRDDQAETFLLRQSRQSGTHGLACMPLLTERNGVRLLRPLLCTPKKMLIDYLRSQNQLWIEDPSNRNEDFTRVKIRRTLAHRSAVDIQHLHAQVREYGANRAAEEMQVAQLLARHARIFPQGYARFHFTGSAKEKLLPKLLVSLLRTVSGYPYPPRSQDLARLVQTLNSAAKKATLGGCVLVFSERRHEQGWLSIYREAKWVTKYYTPTAGEPVLWDNRFVIEIQTENPEILQDCRVRALHAEGLRQLPARLRDSAETLPKMALYTLPALWHLDSVAAVPHIHYELPAFSGIRMTADYRPAVAMAPAPFAVAETVINA